MSDIEKASLFDVSGPADKPKQKGQGIKVQFNPSSLKVTLANSLKENERSGNTRATQYVDKSSSSLSVELIFDTTLDWDPSHDEIDKKTKKIKEIPDRHKDVRILTKKIALAYMFQPKVGNKKTAPKRCMFVWGTFAFVGVMESFDETLDFFASEGTPLRSTVSIKMTESRFQFETREAKAADRDTPTLGSGSEPVPNWRDPAMYNGLESPRPPSSSAMSMPSTSMGESLGGGGFGGSLNGGLNGGLSGGLGGGIGMSSGLGVSSGASFSAGASVSGGFSSSSASFTAPVFSYGSSGSLGSGIPGAFSASITGGGLTAGSIVAANASTSRGSLFTASASSRSSTGQATASASISSSGSAKASASIGFD